MLHSRKLPQNPQSFLLLPGFVYFCYFCTAGLFRQRVLFLLFYQTTGWPLTTRVAARMPHGLLIVPLIETGCGVGAFAGYLMPQPPRGSALPKGLLALVTVTGKYPSVLGHSCSGRELTSWYPRDSKPSPCRQSATKLSQNDTQFEAQQRQLEPKQTDLGEAGRESGLASSRLWARPLSR